MLISASFTLTVWRKATGAAVVFHSAVPRSLTVPCAFAPYLYCLCPQGGVKEPHQTPILHTNTLFSLSNRIAGILYYL